MSYMFETHGADCHAAAAGELDLAQMTRPFDLIEYDTGTGMCKEHQNERSRKMKETFLPMYKEGVPLFTKAMLEEVDRQIRDFVPSDRDQTIHVTGIDGKKYDFVIGHGRFNLFPYPAGVEGVREKLTLMYRPIQDVCSANGVGPDHSYCSVTVQQHVVPRYEATGRRCLEPDEAIVKQAHELFRKYSKEWEEGSQCRALRGLLESVAMKHQVKKIIAFACGTMLTSDASQNCTSSYQHALILTLRDIFSKKQESMNHIECFAQDPSYTDIDRNILRTAGVEILDDPRGFIEADESTVIISIAPNVPVKQIIADVAKPVLIIWDEVIRYEDEEQMLRAMLTDPTSPRVVDMVDTFYNKLDFPEDEAHFGSAAVYARI